MTANNGIKKLMKRKNWGIEVWEDNERKTMTCSQRQQPTSAVRLKAEDNFNQPPKPWRKAMG